MRPRVGFVGVGWIGLHRMKAIALVNDAIAQVEKGVGYDRHH